MRVAVIGGIWKLAGDYGRTVERCGHSCVQYNGYARAMRSKLEGMDAIILFTRTVSHQAANVARDVSRSRGIPLVCASGSGVSSLRHCLQSL